MLMLVFVRTAFFRRKHILPLCTHIDNFFGMVFLEKWYYPFVKLGWHEFYLILTEAR